MRYIDDLLMLNNTWFEGAIVDIYPPELRLKNTTEYLLQHLTCTLWACKLVRKCYIIGVETT